MLSKAAEAGEELRAIDHLKVCTSLRVTRHNTCDVTMVEDYGMHGTANCRTVAIMHRHRDALDRILYTQDSEILIVLCDVFDNEMG